MLLAILINFQNFIKKSPILSIVKQFRYVLNYSFSKEILSEDLDKAYSVLESNNPDPDSTCIHSNNVDSNPLYDLQIVVPTYNTEKYLEACIDSIINQETSYTWKLTIVNDGSTDNTGDILSKYATHANIEIINSKNGGPSARNLGIQNITAKYVTFIDSDDYIPQGAVQSLMNCAFKNDADIVEGAHFRLYDTYSIKYNHLKEERIEDTSKLIGMPWGKVYKSTLFENLIFPMSLWFEDSICTFFLYQMADRIYTIPNYVYYYRIVGSSISHSSAKKPKSIDTIWVTRLILKEYSLLGLPKDLAYHNKIMQQIILNEKRLSRLSEEIQKAAFTVTADLLSRYSTAYECDKKYHPLYKFITSMDYGHYKLFCETH
ncbi:glycosyltransferase family 2 protein [Butyrivibrio sp. AE3006]|uniref:glycosyltransferase family 2 protein n=1 Tax=Butyrivibrio sp. AE3006 TaxID=1280673 RepID=UPI00040846AE|nr:glycosyltransferase [Butyrivibrio sp. AE3006]